MFLHSTSLSASVPALQAVREQHKGLGWWANTTAKLFSRAEDARDLQPARTKPSDDQGFYCIEGQAGAASGCVQAFTGRGVEWLSVSAVAATAPFPFGTITASAYCAPELDSPNLLMQVVPSGPDTLLLYLALQPRVDVALDHAYLCRYYQQPPGASTDGSAAAAADGDGAAANGAAAAAGGGAPPSWHALQAGAWALQGWAHYRSRGLEMGAMGAGLDIFGTFPSTDENLEAVECLCGQALDLWLGFVAEAEAAAERAPAAPAAAARRAARDAAVRSLLLKDPDTAMAERLFGRDPFQTLLKVAGHHPDVRLQLAADVQAREA